MAVLATSLSANAFPLGVSWIEASAPIALGRAGTSPVVARYIDEPADVCPRALGLGASEATATPAGQVQVLVRVGSIESSVTIVRIAGGNRYGTALAASARAFGPGTRSVVIATGSNWPDALGGSALAGAANGPLLLTGPTALPDAVRAEIVRLGANRVYLLGGTAAVSAGVEQALVSLVGRAGVVRLGGRNRYETARLVADETIRLLGGAYSGDALVATGGNFPDATAGAALAAALGRPILLAPPRGGSVYVPAATSRVMVLGGPAAVSSATERALIGMLGVGAVTRAGGGNRYATAALIAQRGVSAGMTWDGVGLATGTDYPDALAGGAMLGARGSVLLLTQSDRLTAESAEMLSMHADVIRTVHIFGGTRAVAPTVEEQLRLACCTY